MQAFEKFREFVDSWAAFLGPNIYLQAAAIALVFIIVAKIADVIIGKVVSRIARKSRSVIDDQLVHLLHKPVFISVILIGLALATHRLGLPAAVEFFCFGVLKTIGVFVWLGFLRRLLKLVVSTVSRGMDSAVAWRRMMPLIDTIGTFAIFALAIYFLFLAWNIDVTAWLASAGIIGLALSFAAKDTLANLFAGVSILADAPYKVGDFIILESGERGMVTQIGFRSTRILTRDDVEITIPNGIIGNGKIINEAGGPSEKHRIRASVGVAYGSDIDRVIAVLENVARDHDEVCKNPEPRVRFRAFGESSLDFELLCWIEQPVNRGRISHEVNCAIYKAFRESGIEIPFPQRDLYIKSVPQSLENPVGRD
jgi:small-conductance mechanosensitive channel